MVQTPGRSVAELRLESERTRAELMRTVDDLRYKISDTAADIREKVSPENIKAEMQGYVARRSRDLADALKQQALAHPMQTLAAGSAIAVPAMRLLRNVPLPVLMIGAGLALASPRVRQAIAEQVPGLKDEHGRNLLDDAAEFARDGFDAARAQAERTMEDARDKAAQMSEDLKQRAADLADATSDAVSSKVNAASDEVKATMNTAAEQAKDAFDRTRMKATDTLNSAKDTVRDHSVLVAGAGLALGALIALSLPAMRRPSNGGGARQSLGGADDLKAAAQFRASEAGADDLTTVADESVTTAFEPSQSHHR